MMPTYQFSVALAAHKALLNESFETKNCQFSFNQDCRTLLRRATLMVGPNNVGKSTICEALDLVLGPDRISKFPSVEEFDFHNACYLAPAAVDGELPTAVPIKIEVVIVDINSEVENRCGQHLEFWHSTEKRLLNEGEIDAANPPFVVQLFAPRDRSSLQPGGRRVRGKNVLLA
jgi:predicted ATP-dependent endonuclease of OLD family